MPTDPKWRTIAKASGQRIGDVMAVFLHVLVDASNASERGRTQSINHEDIASALDMETSEVASIFDAMQGRVIDGDAVLGWDKRQPIREDGASERAKAWREARKEEKRTQANASERNTNATERPDTDKDKDTDKERIKSITPIGVVSIADEKQSRLAEVTQQAIDAFNATLSIQSGGLLSAVTLCSDKRKAQVKRTLKLASQACERLYGAKTVTPEFWKQYFEEVAQDPFKSGKGPYHKPHENWRPDFEYLTRPEVVEAVIDDAMSRSAAA